jgi:hypothetical protein
VRNRSYKAAACDFFWLGNDFFARVPILRGGNLGSESERRGDKPNFLSRESPVA